MGRWGLKDLNPPPFLLSRENRKGACKLARETVEVPITGKIISVNVKAGDQVKEDDVLCVLESMKMENPIVATVGGTVVEVGVKVDQVVKPGETVAVIEY
jgi:biotin carboxyl carrier protein